MKFTYKGKTLPFRVTLKEFVENGVAMTGTKKKDNWAKFPREMLKARCMATAIRAICPEAMDGMYTQEEVADFASNAPAQTVAPVVVAKVEAVSPSPIAAEAPAPAAPIDYGICPCGSVKGKAWTELSTETLEKILASKAKLVTPEHRNAIVEELGRRENAEAEVVNAEVVEG